MRLVHISDLHFGAVSPDLPAFLREAILKANPELLIVSGDLTQRGRAREFEEARVFLDSIAIPQLVVPGNHDVPRWWVVWERFRRPWRHFRRLVQEDLEPVWSRPGLFVMGTNSARTAGWHLDWSRGRLSHHQMARMVKLGQAVDEDSLRVLVVHHPPAAPPQGTRRHLIGRQREFSQSVNLAGVDLVLAGHFHISYAQTLRLSGGSAARNCVLSAVSTAISHRLKGEPNGFHVIEGDARKLSIQAWTWDGMAYKPGRLWRFQRGEGKRDWQEV
ncbi:metallophosphoesterase family protein [Prosthecobacter dejongeii]|uniref:3',5'-cyclic AMP phosphodiesterase CpdA n=1 Tax=Prosthecobacter dejongeii TaxID=48465 RepID=A0A7W7YME7_9BACT|nr:metallophosphoesterase [Prosthecobacter dejongeii]MBB5038881.1 3',5'-cyclic AMP phosphodiesterase CpdA [Prosthecobacter dejongeii]